MVVHNETSTGCVTYPLEVRKAMDRTKHPALLMVDTISGLASMEYEHDAWGVDVSVGGSQKGLMLPPGLASTRSRKRRWRSPRPIRRCDPIGIGTNVIAFNKIGTLPYTPAINLLFGLREAIAMLEEEGSRTSSRATSAMRRDPRGGESVGTRARLPRPAGAIRRR